MASVEERKNAPAMIEQFRRMYKARKKAVTLRMDADVLAWFKREGGGYQTRIKRALNGGEERENRGSEERCFGRALTVELPPQAKSGLEWATRPKPEAHVSTAADLLGDALSISDGPIAIVRD